MRLTCRRALLCLGLAFPAAAAAHGGSAKIERVAAVDDDGAPWLLQLSDGLALRQAEGWRFVCPAAFEASSILQALSADGQTVWVTTIRGVFRIALDGTPEGRAGKCGDSPIELVAHRGAVFALARDSLRREFVVCELAETGPREVHASALAVDDLISDGEQLWLVRATNEGFELEPIGVGEPRAYRTGPHRAVRLAFAGGSLYASLIDFGRTTLVRILPDRVEVVFESASSLYGPVESRGRAVAGTRGRLFALEGPQLWPIDTSLLVENVDGLAGRGFAFAGGALYEIPDSASPTGALFEIDDVRPPLQPTTSACAEQWQLFEVDRHGPDHTRVDAGSPANAVADASDETHAAGCSSGGRAAGASPAALVFCVGLGLYACARARRRWQVRRSTSRWSNTCLRPTN